MTTTVAVENHPARDRQQIRRRAELLDSEVQDRNRRIAGLETEVSEQDSRLVDLSRELREREDRIREIEQERFLLTERVRVLDTELPPLRERENSLTAQVGELQGALADEQESLRMRGEELATALRRVEDMRHAMSRHDLQSRGWAGRSQHSRRGTRSFVFTERVLLDAALQGSNAANVGMAQIAAINPRRQRLQELLS